MPKFQFEEIEVISNNYTVEAPNLVTAIQMYEEKRENFRYGTGVGEVKETSYKGPRPVCDNCGEVPSRVFSIACCRAPSFIHSKRDIEVMNEIAREEE